MATELMYEAGHMTADQLAAEVAELWGRLGTDPELQADLQAAEIDAAEVQSLDPATAIQFTSKGEGLLPGTETVLVTLAAKIAYDIWKEVALPWIRRRRGWNAVGPEAPKA